MGIHFLTKKLPIINLKESLNNAIKVIDKKKLGIVVVIKNG